MVLGVPGATEKLWYALEASPQALWGNVLWFVNFSRNYIVEHSDKWQENTSAGPSSKESNQFNLEILCEESSCNHREKEIVFENLISFLYQIAPIKCKWCEIISFLFCVLPFLWAELCKIVLGWLKLNHVCSKAVIR